MAVKRGSSGVFALVGLALATLAARQGLRLGFVVTGARNSRRGGLVARRSFESGKVNLGVEIEQDVPPPPSPTIECEEECMTAIMDCLEDGCSVEALTKLDRKLAEDEGKLMASVGELREAQKTA